MSSAQDSNRVSTNAEAWKVGDCAVDPTTNEVSCGDRCSHLEPRSMEVLVHLIRHAGEVVPRDQLQSAIWGEIVVGDESLTNAIIKIRKAFGDDARNPRFVETIPKRGYRLIAAVQAGPDPAPAQQESAKSRRTVLGWWPLGLGALAAAVVVALFLGMAQAPNTAAVQARGDATSRSARVMIKPFVNISGDAEKTYLVRGLEETIVNRLSAESELTVMHLPEGTQGDADFVLEGTVQPRADRLRVTLRLMDARTGAVLADERLERPGEDLLEIEQAIEERLSKALSIDIAQADLARRAAGYTTSTQAFDLFLRAQSALLTRNRDGNRRALSLYRRAITHDPRFARAYGGLALGLAAEYRNAWAKDPQAALSEALEMAQTALQIAPDLPEQYWVIGYVLTQERDFPGARTALDHALALRPDYADALALLGGIATYAGQPEQSIPLLRKAMRLRPQAGYLYFLLLARAYYYLDDCGQAEINLTEAINRNPDNIEARLYHAACLQRLDDSDAAEWEIEEVRAIEPAITADGFFRSYPMSAQTQIKRLRADLMRSGLL